MKKNRLTIQIDRSAADVFRFTIDPVNTPRWVSSIVKEEADTPVGMGSRYRNLDHRGKWSEYEVTKFEPNSIFELSSVGSPYKVRYSYTSMGPEKMKLEYFEWVEKGELPDPFTQETLENLKKAIESRS